MSLGILAVFIKNHEKIVKKISKNLMKNLEKKLSLCNVTTFYVQVKCK